jgi:hypothetical protein
LSWYERLQKRHSRSIRSAPEKPGNIDTIARAVVYLKERALRLRAPGMPGLQLHPELNRTVVVMPFLGSDMGAGHSKLGNRLVYLSACFWSFYAEFPHVVAVVKSEKDVLFAR